jgi:eukaryotic-like serine/threonine-protein kinase
MPASIERRRWNRIKPKESAFCVIQASDLACNIDSCSTDLLYIYVDLINFSTEGALLQAPFRMQTNANLIVSLPESSESFWTNHQARVAWTNKADNNSYFTGVEFTKKIYDKDLKIFLEAYPHKLSPSDLSFLINFNSFQIISRMGLSALLNSLHKISIRPGQKIITKGEPGDCFYLIQKGNCVVFVETPDRVHIIARLKPGDVVGEMAVLTGEPRLASVSAETEMILWRIGKDQFEALAETNPDLRLFLTEIMVNRFDTSSFTGDRTIGKYVLSKRIGRGSWGIVYLGMHKHLKMPVAVKMLKHDMAMEKEFLEIFRREAEIIASICHQNIVYVYDIEEVYKTIFIIMEYLDGVPLREYLKKLWQLPVELCVKILLQICDGLSCAHNHNIVHRDIKPENIFLVENDFVKILDFGLACVPGTEDMNVMGTVFYASPEQIECAPVDIRSDLYSLGIMTYEMITGKRPYPELSVDDLMYRHCSEDIPDPAESLPALPEKLRDFIIKCCQRDPDRRYQNAQQAKEDLLKLSGFLPELPVHIHDPQAFTSLLISHPREQKSALKGLLDELCVKAAQLGINIQVDELKK